MSNEELKKELKRQRNFLFIILIVLLLVGFLIIAKIQHNTPNPIIGKTISVCFTEPVEIGDLVKISDPANRHNRAKVITMIKKANDLGGEDVLPSYQEIKIPILSLKARFSVLSK